MSLACDWGQVLFLHYLFIYLFFELGPLVAQAGLELALKLRMNLELPILLNSGFIGRHHHTWLMLRWGLNPGPPVYQANALATELHPSPVWSISLMKGREQSCCKSSSDWRAILCFPGFSLSWWKTNLGYNLGPAIICLFIYYFMPVKACFPL